MKPVGRKLDRKLVVDPLDRGHRFPDAGYRVALYEAAGFFRIRIDSDRIAPSLLFSKSRPETT